MTARLAGVLAALAACSSVPDEAPGVDTTPPEAGPDAPRPDGHIDCIGDLTCPAAAAGTVHLCGWLRDLEWNQTFQDADDSLLECHESRDDDGPCQVGLSFEDAPTRQPLAIEQVFYDPCGRFRATGVTTPASGVVAIVTDDAAGLPDLRKPTAIAVPIGDGEVRNRLAPYTLRSTTETIWNAVAGRSFVDDGAVLELYLHGGQRVAGVPIAGSDFAFADLDDRLRFVAPAMTSTGANGAVLRTTSVDALPEPGTMPAGCSWSTPYAAIEPGVLWFSTRAAVRDDDGSACE